MLAREALSAEARTRSVAPFSGRRTVVASEVPQSQTEPSPQPVASKLRGVALVATAAICLDMSHHTSAAQTQLQKPYRLQRTVLHLATRAR